MGDGSGELAHDGGEEFVRQRVPVGEEMRRPHLAHDADHRHPLVDGGEVDAVPRVGFESERLGVAVRLHDRVFLGGRRVYLDCSRLLSPLYIILLLGRSF